MSICNGYLWVFEDWLVIGKEYPGCHLVGLVIGECSRQAQHRGIGGVDLQWLFVGVRGLACDWQGVPSVPPCGACDWLVFGTGSAQGMGCRLAMVICGVLENWLVIGKGVRGKSMRAPLP